MEIGILSFHAAHAVAAAAATLLLGAWLLRGTKSGQPRKWPVIGHLHLFLGGGAAPLHAKLAALADQYGPIMHLRLGSKPTVIVSDARIARECFTTNDLAFASRPCLAASKILGIDLTAIPWVPYGELWRELRKICTLELLSARRLEAAAYIRDQETFHSVRKLHTLSRRGKAKIKVREHLAELILRVIMRMVAGRSSESFGRDHEAKELKELTDEAFVLSGVPNIGDSLPFLKWLDLQGAQKAMKRVAATLEAVARSWLDSRRKMNEEKKDEGYKENPDFIDVLLRVEQDNDYIASLPPDRRDLIIVATLLTMVLATLDTTSLTMEWTLALLMKHPETMRRAQEELDSAVGRERKVEETDIPNLPYLQAVVKETLRLHPAGPLLLPHESTEECVVAGSRVSAGTRLFVNAWKIHRDPALWKNPLNFEPERFLGESADVDVRGRHFQLIPFGSGRRICPGISLSLSLLNFSLARLLHSFKFLIPDGELGNLDMREGLGLTTPKHIPLEVVLVPRLPSELY